MNFSGNSKDRLLGMDARISREDFVNGIGVAQGSAPHTAGAQSTGAEDWDGYGGEGDYAGANGNTYSVMTAGHLIRDHIYDNELSSAYDTGEIYDCVVVGGGISGLAAAHLFTGRTHSGKTCLVLEDHAIFGGEARRNEFLVDGQRLMANQGSAMFFPPLSGSFMESFYRSIGFDGRAFDYQDWGGGTPVLPVSNTPYANGGPYSGMFFGARFGHPEGLWLVDPWGKELAGAPFPEPAKGELLRARQSQPQFAGPQVDGDAVSRALDRITQEEHMTQRDGLSKETIRAYMPYAASAAGASADVISAYADYAPDVLFPWDKSAGSQMFPGGNTGIARLLVKSMLPEALPGPPDLHSLCLGPVNFSALDRPGQPVRIRLGTTVARVQNDGDARTATTVSVVYAMRGKLQRVRARAVVMAGGWTTWRTVGKLPESHRVAYRQFFRMPCLVMNVALHNWKFLANMGITECQWYQGLGDSLAMRTVAKFGGVPSAIRPADPTVLTLKILFTEPGLPLAQQATRGRMRMLSTPYAEYERTIREQFTLMFGRAGFDARRDIAGIILNRWGHAYLCAQPGFFFGTGETPAPRQVIRDAPFGRIAFANSDLSGIMDHRASITEANRAVEQLLA